MVFLSESSFERKDSYRKMLWHDVEFMLPYVLYHSIAQPMLVSKRLADRAGKKANATLSVQGITR